jgi:hypothetical protein
VLGYGADEWRRLAWWTRQAYINGILWEIDNGGWFAQRVIPAGDGSGGGESAPAAGTFVPLDSMEARAAEGITVLPAIVQ